MPFKAAIFDFGGVFTTSPVTHFAAFEDERGLPARFLGAVVKARPDDGAFARFERGELTLDAFDTAFADETRAAGFEVTGRTLLSLMRLRLYPQMTAALRRVKAAGYITGCITNTMPHMDRYAMVREEDAPAVAEIFALFDHVIESADAGVRKPEPRIYEMMCAALGVAPAECIFVDDLGVNLKAARALGMTPIRAPFDDIAPAIGEIERILSL